MCDPNRSGPKMEVKPIAAKGKKSKSTASMSKAIIPPKNRIPQTTSNCRHFNGAPYRKGSQLEKCEALCRIKLKCGHFCPKYCFETCEPCEVVFSGEFNECHHTYRIQCSYKENTPYMCPAKVQAAVVPDCGHKVLVACKDRNRFTKSKLSKLCAEPCVSAVEFEYGGCGDPCDGVCGSCDNGIFHKRCTQPCGKTLICGHICEVLCSKNCLPCPKTCLTSCEHETCRQPCGVPCQPCQWPCPWECPHSKCTRTCGEVCDREPCNFPCPKLLRCGHSCVGLCGEPCPDLCRYCNRGELIHGFFDGSTTIEEDDRFIFLPDCGHTFEVSSLNAWMNVDGENGEIVMKTCPLCRSIIWTCRRYCVILKRKREDHNDLKIRIYGAPEKIRESEVNMLNDLMRARNPRGIFDEFRLWLIRQVTDKKDDNDVPIIKEMNQTMVSCLEYLSSQWKVAEQKFCRLEREYDEDEFNVVEHYYREIWNFVKTREIPLTLTEVADMERQFDRIGDLTQLMDRRANENGLSSLNIQENPRAVAFYYDVYEILSKRVPYTSLRRRQFFECLQKLDGSLKSQLRITENERILIVRAFGHATGRWFKCVNGHIYVVTECGGPTQLGTCNECGTPVGGTDHLAVEGNNLATEMDGATVPLYPTALVYTD